jgi:hypothetical protein
MANCTQLQQPKQAAGIHVEAEASNEEVQDASPEEEFDVIDQDQPQGEDDKPEYEEYPMDIPQEWDEEDVGYSSSQSYSARVCVQPCLTGFENFVY